MFQRRIIFRILTILWMVIIFSFSAKNAQASTGDSNAVGMLVGKIVYSDFQEWPRERQQAFADQWSYPIRKGAHMSEYALLGFFLVGAFLSKEQNGWRTVRIAFPMAVLYAVSDEIHQFFVPGRSCMLTDIGYDSAGAALGIGLGMLAFYWMGRRASKAGLRHLKNAKPRGPIGKHP